MQPNNYNSINKIYNNQNTAFQSLNLLRETSNKNKQNYSTIDTNSLFNYKQYTNYSLKSITKVFFL